MSKKYATKAAKGTKSWPTMATPAEAAKVRLKGTVNGQERLKRLRLSQNAGA